ncbi:hypothetical protein M0R88_07995 [Halorussus gelatinilyticus]|uniref:Uncharacterized protein n=1 Tax=Halorussus gelatinilyticus TaxID=2937524 RepID=A0A8U0IN20_9EURY|nr:hypothetical protein [Halorussus gelatinilyticus]UPW02025.1 hypothetical protein M0R88_07995 [Halorussus gelatinilyticus]
MADRISSDHSSLTTVRATLVRSGGLDRPKVEIPADDADAFPDGELVRVVADDTEYRARIESPLTDDGREIRGLYDSPTLARNPEDGENRLSSWMEGTDVEFGQSVLVDVIEEGFKYGLREPGERVFYDATESPDESLADIASGLDE